MYVVTWFALRTTNTKYMGRNFPERSIPTYWIGTGCCVPNFEDEIFLRRENVKTCYKRGQYGHFAPINEGQDCLFMPLKKKELTYQKLKGLWFPLATYFPLPSRFFFYLFFSFFFLFFSSISDKQHGLCRLTMLRPPTDCTHYTGGFPKCWNFTASNRGQQQARTTTVTGAWLCKPVIFSTIFLPTLEVFLAYLNGFEILMKFWASWHLVFQILSPEKLARSPCKQNFKPWSKLNEALLWDKDLEFILVVKNYFQRYIICLCLESFAKKSYVSRKTVEMLA